MADDLNLILKAMLDVADSKKDIKLVIDSLNKSSDLGKIKIGTDFDVSKIKRDLKDVQTAFTEIYVDGKIKKEITSIENSIGELTKKTKTFNKEGIVNTEEYTTSYKKQNEQREKAIQLQKELNISADKFTVKNLSDMYKLSDSLDTSEIQKIREQFSKIKINEDGSNINDISNQVKLLNNQYDVLINKSKLQKNINDDALKVEEKKVKEAEKIANLYKEIKNTLDKLPSSVVGSNNTQDMYSLLDSTNSIDDLKALKTLANDYYNESILSEKELQQVQKNRSQSIKETFNDYKKMQEISAKVDSGLANVDAIKLNNSGTNIDDYNKLADAWKNIRNQVENGTMDFQEANAEIKKLTTSTKEFKSASEKASSATNTLGDRLKKAFQYFTFYDALQLGKRAVESMIETIFDLDDALVELRKVSNLSGDSLSDFTQQAYTLGSQISKSGSEILRASTEFSRAGYGEDELLNLAEASLKLTSIGDGLTNTAESASTLIAVLKGFKKDTSEVTNIMDAINNVSNNASVNFSDLTNALTRTAGTMSASNTTLEQTLGLFTAINEVLRNTEMSSTALNSMSMRIRGLNEDGEAIDGLAPKLQGMFKDIAKIDITDSMGQVDSLFEIAGKLSPVWNTLTENQRQYIAQEAAGIRQSKAFLVMMNNYDRVLEATDLAYQSAGSSAKEFATWQDSLEGRTNLLKSSLEQFSTKTINSNFVKSIISATTSIVNLGTAMGGAVTPVLALTSAFVAFKLVTGAIALGSMSAEIVKIVTSIGLILPALGTATLVASAIMGIGLAINYVVGESDRAKQAISKLSGELDDLKSKSSNIESLGKTYISLKGIDDKTTDQLNEYYDTQNKIKELMPEISGFYNEQGNFIIENVNNLTDLTSIQKEYIKLKREELALAEKENMNNTIKSYEKSTKQLDYLQWLKSINMLSKSGESELRETADKVRQYTTDMSDSILQVVISTQNWANLTEDEANAIRKAYSELDSDTKQDYAKQIEDNTFNTQQFINTLSEYPSAIKYMETATKDATIANNELASSFLSVEDGLKKLTSISSDAEKINTILKSLNKGDKVSANDIETLLGISDEYLIYLDDEIKLREKLTQSMSDYASSYEATYNQMLGTSAEYYQTKIKDDVNTRKKLEDNISNYFKTLNLKYNEDLKEYTDFENAKGKVTSDVVKQIAGVWAKYFDSSGNLINGSTAFTNTDKKLDPFISDKVLDQANKKATDNLRVIQGKIWEAQAGYDALVKEIAYVPVGMDFDKNESGVGSKDKTDAWKEAFEKQYKEIQYLEEKHMISTQQYYNTLDSLNNKYFANQTKYLDEYRQYDLELYNLEKEFADKRIKDKEFQISLLDFDSGEDATFKQIEIYKQMQSEVHSLAEKARKLGISENDEYIQNLKTQWIGYSNDIGDLITSSYEKQNQAIEDSLKLLDVELSKYKTTNAEYKNITDQKYNLILQQEELLKKRVAELYKEGLKKEAEELEKTFVDLYQKRIELAKEYQSIETDNLQSQIDILEEQKTALESLHNMTMQMIKDELNARKKQYQEEINDIKKVFDAKKKSITDAEDERKYNKELAKKTTVVADLENQLAIIKNDKTAIAKRKQLEDELVKAKEDLDEYQRDRSIELQEDALDKQLELETDKLQDEIDKIDKTLSNEVKLRELANERIRKSGEKLKNQLIAHAKEYGSFTIEEVSNAWDTAGEAVDSFNSKQKGLLGTLKEISQELIDTQKRLKEIEKLSTDDYASSIGKPTTSTNKESTIAKMQSNSEAWNKADAQEKKRLSEENQKLGKALGLTYDSSTGAWFYDKEKKLRVYHEGGIVGGSKYASSSMNQLFDLLKSDEEIAKLQRSEGVITSSHADKIMGMIANNNTTNNSEAFSPTVIFNFEGQPNENYLQQFEKKADEFIDRIFNARNERLRNTGFKKKFGT